MTLRQRITTSTLLLPFAILLAAVVWCAEDYSDARSWAGFGLCMLTTLALMELNNRNTLLRVRSRMVSTTFLLVATAMPFLHAAGWYWLSPLCLVGAFALLFASYQKMRPEGEVFHAFLLLSVASFRLPLMLGLAPLFYASMLFSLRSLTWRSFFAGIFGLLLPYLFYALWCACDGTLLQAFDFIVQCRPTLPRLSDWPLRKMVNVGFIGLQIFLGLLHYYRTNFNDKIRVRMAYYTIVLQLLALLGAFVFFPQFDVDLFLLLLTSSSVLIAHYWTLARGGAAMTAWFVFNILLLVALGVANAFYL